jgi:hypothetical protein
MLFVLPSVSVDYMCAGSWDRTPMIRTMGTRERLQRKEAAPASAGPSFVANPAPHLAGAGSSTAPTNAPGHSFTRISVTAQPQSPAVAATSRGAGPLSEMQPPIPGNFIPESIVNDLTRAIDQSKATLDYDNQRVIRKVDAALVMRVLDNLTAKEAAAVRSMYDAKARRDNALHVDLFGGGASEVESSLTKDQRARIGALLKGTRPESAEATTSGRIEADVAELHELLSGGLKDDKLERVMALHRRPLSDIGRLDAYYQTLHTTSLPQALHDTLKGLQQVRMLELRMGNWAKADACAIEDKGQAIARLDSSPVDPFKIDERNEKREKLVAGIEAVVEQNRQEAIRDAESSGKTHAQATKERLGAIMESRVGEGGASVGEGLQATLKTKGEAIVAIGNGSLVEAAALRLLEMEKSESTKTAKIEPVLRGFRVQAEQDIIASMYGTRWSQAEKEAIAADAGLRRRLIDTQAKRYTDDFIETYDALPGEHRTWAEIVASAHDYNRDMLNALIEGGGKVDDLVELDVAIRRKNGDQINAVLQKQPNKRAMDDLAARYEATRGVSLSKVLFGTLGNDAATANEMMRHFNGALLGGRTASAAQEALAKPSKFGGDEEVDWIAKHGVGERNVTEANSGAMGSLREIGDDPETQNLMNRSAARLVELQTEWKLNLPGGRPRAHILAEMRRMRVTLTGDATAYEEDNARMVAELRTAVSFAVQIALAVALPGFPSNFIATMALNIGANVASNMVIWGDQYSLTSFRNDVLGGVLGGVGGRFGEEVAGAIASKVTGTAAKGTIEAAEQAGLSIGLAKQAGAAASMAGEASLVVKAAQQGGNLVGGAAGGTLATNENQFTFESFAQGAFMNAIGGLRAGGPEIAPSAGGEPPRPTAGESPAHPPDGGPVTAPVLPDGHGPPSSSLDAIPDDFTFTAEGPVVRTPVDPSGRPADVLEIGAGPTDTNLGLAVEPNQGDLTLHDPALVNVTRTDLQPRDGVAMLDATEDIPPDCRDQDAVVINNPYGYNVDIARVGQALRPGGRLVVQGRARVAPGMRGTNRHMNELLTQVTGGDLPNGFRVVEVVTLPETPIGDSRTTPKPGDIMGGPFQQTSGGPVSWPNTRIVIERIPNPLSDMSDAQIDAFLDQAFHPHMDPDPDTAPPGTPPPDAPSPGQAPPADSNQAPLDFRPTFDPDRPETKSLLSQSIADAMTGVDTLGKGHEPRKPAAYYAFVHKTPSDGSSAAAADRPVPGEVIPPDRLRETYGMPPKNQAAFQRIAEKHGVEILVRPTVKEAAQLLETDAAIPKAEDLKSKTINDDDVYLGARKEDIGKVGFFKPDPPLRPDGISNDDWNRVVERFKQRDAEYWDNAKRMTELQRQADAQAPKSGDMDDRGTHQEYQIVVGENGVVQAVLSAGGSLKEVPFTGDHDVFDIRNADGTPVTAEKYQEIVSEMKAAVMGVAHGAHIRWAPKTPAEVAIFWAIVNKHGWGSEILIRFGPGGPATIAGPR